MLQAASTYTAFVRPLVTHAGPERRRDPACAEHLLAMMLDEIDYGMLLVDDMGTVLHLNRAARGVLDAGHPLHLFGRELRAQRSRDLQAVHDALTSAVRRGLRKLVSLGEGAQRATVAVLPLGEGTALVVLGKRRLSEGISVQCFARLHGLTPAETRVLEGLCEGLEPKEIAQRHGVGLATVRTQISTMRAKTAADTIRDLVRQVAVLPPMVGVLCN